MPSNAWFWSGVGATGLALLCALATCALRSFSRTRLEAALRARSRLGRLKALYAHHDDLVQVTGALHVVCLVAAAGCLEAWASARFGGTAGAALAGLALAAALGLVFGAAIPMAWAKYAPESVLRAMLPALLAARTVLLPGLRVLRLLDRLVRRLAGVTGRPAALSSIEEEIRSVVSEGEREGALEEDQKDMIEGVIRFRRADVTQIMTPRTDIESLDAEATLPEAYDVISRTGFSRIPVTQGNLDSIVGIVYAKDLLVRGCGAGTVALRARDVMRKPLFVPETKKLDELLHEFQAAKVHVAIVLDEYGGTAGLVTIEDILEEIVGEIVDEYEEAPPEPIRRGPDGSWDVEARVRIDQVNDELAVRLPEGEDYETIGGYVLARLGYIPEAGETLDVDGLRITVVEAEPRRIRRLRIDTARRPAEPG